MTGWNLNVGEICNLVKSDKSETGWNLISKVGAICKLVKSATVGTMDLGKNLAEPTGECKLRIVRRNWVQSASWWNLQVGEIWQKRNWVKSECWWNLQAGENCNSGDNGLGQKSGRAQGWVWAQNCPVKWVKSESWWNLQAEICKWVKREQKWVKTKSTIRWNMQVGRAGKISG